MRSDWWVIEYWAAGQWCVWTNTTSFHKAIRHLIAENLTANARIRLRHWYFKGDLVEYDVEWYGR